MRGALQALATIATLAVLSACCSGPAAAEEGRAAPRVESAAPGAAAAAEFAVRMIAAPDTGAIERIEVTGVPAGYAERLRQAIEREPASSPLSLRVVRDEGGEVPAMAGASLVEAGRVFILPRYPLTPGVTYELTLPAAGAAGEVRQRFTVPDREKGPPATVVAIYPGSGELPENQLKFYLHFSAPMSRGQAYDHIRLFRIEGDEAAGKRVEVEDPFLQLGEELWDPSGTRFTLLIDPGRIKRGLKPREEVGPVLEAGRRYVLVVEPGWEDARGNPLAERFEKRFVAGPPDEVQPAAERWKFTVPAEGTREPLSIEFDEPLDRAMLERVLGVKDARGARLAGAITVEAAETRWRFVPETAWRAGEYKLAVDGALEDLAGNSLNRPFEIDVFEKVDRDVAQRIIERKFVIGAPRPGK